MNRILAVLAVAVALFAPSVPASADRPPALPSPGYRPAVVVELSMQRGRDIPICAEKGRPVVVTAAALVRQRLDGGIIYTPASVYLILLDCRGQLLSFDTDPGYPNFAFHLPRRRETITLRVFNPHPDPAIVFIRRN